MGFTERVFVDVRELKDYLKIEFDDDDAVLQTLADAAKEQAALFLNNDFTGTDSNGNPVEFPIPASVTLAIWRLVGVWYENRIAGTTSKTASGITTQYGGGSYGLGGEIPREFFDSLVMYRRTAGL